MMGNDPHCAAWIARNGDGAVRRAQRRAPRRDATAAGGRSRRLWSATTTRSSSSRRPGGAAASRAARSVLDAARRLGVDLDSVCGGRGICGRCQVAVSEGEHAKHGITCTSAALTPVTETEEAYARDRGLATGRRLGCTALVDGGRRRRRAAREPGLPPGRAQGSRRAGDRGRPGRPPLLRRGRGAAARVADERPRAAARRARARVGTCRVFRSIPIVLQRSPTCSTRRRSAWRVTVAVHDGTVVSAVWPGFHDAAYGIAFDVGSTTVAGHLCDLHTGDVLASAGEMNPQIRFGEDLMSRVSYVMLNAGSEKELTRAVRGCLAKLTAELATTAEVERADVLEVTLVGNPVMHHLLLGIDPTELGGAPFALAFDDALRLPAAELGLPVNPGARAYVLPCIAGHVGADTAGVILAEAPHLAGRRHPRRRRRHERRDRAREPGAPAGGLEPDGARVRGRADLAAGSARRPGAIERVRIDPETLEPRVQVIGCDAWSDEPGFADARVTGICGSGIVEVDRRAPARGGDRDGRADRRCARGAVRRGSSPTAGRSRTSSTTGEPELRVTQNDVRQIQLAKAALHAGCTLLMERYGIERVDRGSASPERSAPTSTPSTRSCSGSCPTATRAGHLGRQRRGNRARASRCSTAGAREEIEDVVRRVEKVETAVEPRFQEHFVQAMAIPHETDPYERLAPVAAPAEPHGGAPATTHAPRADRREESHDETSEREAEGAPGVRRRGRTRSRARAVPDTDAEPSRSSEEAVEAEGARRGRRRGSTPTSSASRSSRGRCSPSRCSRRRGSRSSRRTPTGSSRRSGSSSTARRDALELFAGAGASVDGERVRFPGGLCRSLVQATAPRGVHAGRAEPRERRRLRRAEDDLRPRVRLAVRPRPRRRAPLRDDRGLPELREARLRLAVAPPLGRDRLRAGRRAGQQAALRHGLRASCATRTSRSWAR